METGRLLAEDYGKLEAAMHSFEMLAVDQEFPAPRGWSPDLYETTITSPFQLTGPCTYTKGRTSTLYFEPAASGGWQLNRTDLPEQLPIKVIPGNVSNTSRNITLRSGINENYARLTEHVIAHRLGLGLDNVKISSGFWDPPLFDEGSFPVSKGITESGLTEDKSRPLKYYTVKEPVTLPGPNGSFLHFQPADSYKLTLDVAVDFPTVIGKQRIVFDLFKDSFLHGAKARTNASYKEVVLAKTLGILSAGRKSTGYTTANILIAGNKKYINTPGLIHNGRSLEAVWHRACLDLVAALSLFSSGRLAGKVTSYKSGHCLDCRFMTLMELQGLWQEMPPPAGGN